MTITKQIHGSMAVGAVAQVFPALFEFSYHENSPYAVYIAIDVEGDTGEWVVSRDVLIQCVLERETIAGMGDFMVEWSTDWFIQMAEDIMQSGLGILKFHFHSPEANHHAWLNGDPLIEFLTATTDLVPQGSEVVDVDAFLAEVFA